ncbi:hypothetical protein TNCV_2994061 [Trichonephila clavipes]|nr:hypothetical protein TNCV_2994061 [Trichonephila clavipes]
MVDLAGYVICALIRPKGVLWDLDRGSEKVSPVFEHPFRQTMSVQASMFGPMQSLNKRSPGIRQTQKRPSDSQTVKRDSSLQRTVFHMSTVQ